MFPRINNRIRALFIGISIIWLCYIFGVFTHILERDFYTEFEYPLEGDVLDYAKQMRRGEQLTVAPINWYNYSYIYPAEHKCQDNTGRLIRPRLMIVVKSAMNHFDHRKAIRQTWGYEKRFSDIVIRTVFVLGVSKEPNLELQEKIDSELLKYKDIVQGKFIDSYFNNTVKTMMGMRWATTYCPKSKFYLFVDDDYYISIKNILKFIRNPSRYPEYFEEAEEVMREAARKLTSTEKERREPIQSLIIQSLTNQTDIDRAKRQIYDLDLPEDVRIFSGFVFKSSPHRHWTSKWYISLAEYPWHRWPAYVTAGAFVLSREALFDMYYTSFFTKHFRFDDIYLAILAMKARIEPIHCDEFYFQRTNVAEKKYVVASHGFDKPVELIKTWNKMRSKGFA